MAVVNEFRFFVFSAVCLIMSDWTFFACRSR